MKINKRIQNLETWNVILTIILFITFMFLILSVVMIIKIDSKLYDVKEFSENNWDWIQKFNTRILKLEYCEGDLIPFTLDKFKGMYSVNFSEQDDVKCYFDVCNTHCCDEYGDCTMTIIQYVLIIF